MINTDIPFYCRHIGPTKDQQDAMLAALGKDQIEDLIHEALPNGIALDRPLDLPEAVNESEALEALKAIMGKNKIHKSFDH